MFYDNLKRGRADEPRRLGPLKQRIVNEKRHEPEPCARGKITEELYKLVRMSPLFT